MLTELHIENFAIIDHLDLQFGSGLVTFTGETGAGKSIIIDAVECLLGGRAETAMVRSGADRATVEGVFHIPAQAAAQLAALLEKEDLLDDPEYVTLGREIRMNGRNTGRINGRSVSINLLREVGESLIDVHGQSEHLSLLRVNQHLPLLDNFAAMAGSSDAQTDDPSFADLTASYRAFYQDLQKLHREIETLRQSEQDAARRTDMLSFQIKEIETAHLRPTEESELREERNRLANAEGLASLSQEALAMLDEGPGEGLAVTDLMGQVVHALTGLARLDPSQAALLDQVETIAEGVNDLARALRDYGENIEFNPKRLDQVEERLALIHNLKRKYGDTIPDILDFAAKATVELEAISHAEERLEELEKENKRLLGELARIGLALGERRMKAAAVLQKAIEKELADLSMSGARFKVDFQRQPDAAGIPLPDGSRVAYYSSGLEKVEFLIAPNPGEGFKPLVKIASGGETSRLMLALKNVLAQVDQIPSLIFDEIDQGIGGRVGSVIGHKLWELGRRHQVLCITHLPQLAAFGDQHFRVQKVVSEGRTATTVQPLMGENRLAELAQMMGEINAGTMHSAREMIAAVNRQTRS